MACIAVPCVSLGQNEIRARKSLDLEDTHDHVPAYSEMSLRSSCGIQYFERRVRRYQSRINDALKRVKERGLTTGSTATARKRRVALAGTLGSAVPRRPTNPNSLARFQANNPETTNVQSRNGGIKRH